MGTTLTGTTPQDTYDSLIKVTDNGPLSGTAKYLSDGLGNDSVLALSTARVGVATTSPATTLDVAGAGRIKSSLGDYLLTIENIKDDSQGLLVRASDNDSTPIVKFQSSVGATSETWIDRFVVNKDGNVGIGTSSPSTKLTVDNSALGTTRAIDLVGNTSTAKGHLGYFADGVYLSSNYFFDGAQNNDVSGLGQSAIVLQASAGSASNIAFRTSAAGSTATTVRATIDADGLKFNGDTLQVNALDDYEEGTFTPTVSYSTSGTPIYATQSGVYTKIGRSVQVQMVLSWNENGAVGNITIQGLPFASVGTHRAIPSILSFGLTGLPTAVSVTGIIFGSSTAISLFLDDNAGTTLTEAYTDNDQDLYVTVTYQAA